MQLAASSNNRGGEWSRGCSVNGGSCPTSQNGGRGIPSASPPQRLLSGHHSTILGHSILVFANQSTGFQASMTTATIEDFLFWKYVVTVVSIHMKAWEEQTAVRWQKPHHQTQLKTVPCGAMRRLALFPS
jgi:hypothetical protein